MNNMNQKKRTTVVTPPPVEGVQDYTDWAKKIKLNPNPSGAMGVFDNFTRQKLEAIVTTGANANATPRQRKKAAAAVKGLVAIRNKTKPTVTQLPSDNEFQFEQVGDIKPTVNEQVANVYQRDNYERTGSIQLSPDQLPEFERKVTQDSLILDTPVRRGFLQAGAGLLRNTSFGVGELAELAGGDAGVVGGLLGETSEWLAKQSKDTLKLLQAYEQTRNDGDKGWWERTEEFIGQAPPSFAQIIALTRATGGRAYLGMGISRALDAAAQGNTTTADVAGEFLQGMAEGALLTGLGKTAELAKRLPGGAKFSQLQLTGLQATAQGLGGMGQIYADHLLHPNGKAPDWLDYIHGGLLNVVLDPLVLGGNGRKAKQATDSTNAISQQLLPEVESNPAAPGGWEVAGDVADINKPKPPAPPSNLAQLRPDFYQPKDAAWSNETMGKLLRTARVQFIEGEGHPEGTLYVNPQGMAVVDRIIQTIQPGSKAFTEAAGAGGTALTPEMSLAIVDGLQTKVDQIKRTIEQLPDGHPQLAPLAEGAVIYEALAEQFAAGSTGDRMMGVRFITSPKFVSADNQFAAKVDNQLVGHESFHNQQRKIARALGVDSRTLNEPGFLVDHAIGAKVLSDMDNPLSPFKSGLYDNPANLTVEVIAYAAQPAENSLGLTKVERGVLVGDYFASIVRRHGASALKPAWLGLMDAEVREVAIKQLYTATRIESAKQSGTNLTAKQLSFELMGIDRQLTENPFDLPPGVITDSQGRSVRSVIDDEAAPFYSGVLDWAKTKVGNKGVRADQLLGQLRNSKGLRPGEIEAMGLGEWLQGEGNRVISRGELLGELAQREIKVTEIIGVEPNPDTQGSGLIFMDDPETGAATTSYSSFIQPGDATNYKEIFLTAPGVTGSDNYVSHNWGKTTPNILVHMRTTDRVVNGEKVLFVEEVQSDWHQDAAKAHKTNSRIRTATALGKQPSEVNQLLNRTTNPNYDIGAAQLEKTVKGEYAKQLQLEPKDGYADVAYNERKKELAKQVKDLGLVPNEASMKDILAAGGSEKLAGEFFKVFIGSDSHKVPDAPFKKTWSELALRHLLNHAAEGGYDRIAWVRGADAEASVGGNLQWFYDRDFRNMVSKVIGKYGGKIETSTGKDRPVAMNTFAEGMTLESAQKSLAYHQTKLAAAYERLAATDSEWQSRSIQEGIDLIKEEISDHRDAIEYLSDPKPAGVVWQNSIPIPTEFRQRFLDPQPLPLSVNADPNTPDPSDPVDSHLDANLPEDTDQKVNGVDDPLSHLLYPDQTTVEPGKVKPELDAQIKIHERLARDIRKDQRVAAFVRGKLTRAKELLKYTNQLAVETGLEQPDLVEELNQRIADTQAEYTAMREQIKTKKQTYNQFYDNIAGQLMENKQTSIGAAVEAAKQRLANEAYKPNPNDPLEQTILSQQYTESLSKVARDVLVATKATILPKSEAGIVEQMIAGVRSGAIDITTFNEAAERHGMSIGEFYDRLDASASAAGRALNQYSQVRRYFNKMFGNSPEIQAYLDAQAPTLKKIRDLSMERSNARLLVDAKIGALVTPLSTQSINIGSGLFMSTAMGTIANVFDNVTARIVGAGKVPVDFDPITELPTRYEDNVIPPFSKTIEPIFNFARTMRFMSKDIRWFNEGKRSRPAGRPEESWDRTVRIMDAALEAHGDDVKKLNRALGSEITPITETAALDALRTLQKQALALEPGEKRTKLLRELNKRIAAKEANQGVVRKGLLTTHHALHWLLTIARAGERLNRHISFISNLDYKAAKRGFDVVELETEGKMHKLPPEVIDSATEDALRDTMAQRLPVSTWLGKGMQNLAASNHSAWVAMAAIPELHFANFIGNYANFTFSYSPLAWLKVIRAENRQQWQQGDRGWAARAFIGTAAWVMIQNYTKRKYEELDKTNKPQEVWYSIKGNKVIGLPFAPMLFAADYWERSKRGLKPGVKDLNEAINIISGLNTKGMENTFKWMDGLYTLATDQSGQRGRRSAETVLKAFGDWFSAFATPIQQLSDLTGEFDEHQRRLKEQYGLGAGTLFAPTLNKLPSRIPGTGINLRDQLNDQIDPYTGGPVYRSDHPFARQFGFNLLAKMPQVQQIFTQAGIRTPDWAPYVGVPEIDRELTGEIGKWANENSQLILETVADMSYDEQVAILHRTFTDAGRVAYNTVLSRYPDVQRQLTDSRAMSYWEQRVADKQRALDGLPSRESEYEDLKQNRMAEPPPKLLPKP